MTADINAGKGAIGKMAKDEEFARKLQNTLDRLSDVADKLDTGSGTAALFVRDPEVYNNTNKLLSEMRELIKAVRQNPKQYLTIRLKVF
jgi:phospholipid/cholesterol/gamma-HCH transport system substrate-binding protein